MEATIIPPMDVLETTIDTRSAEYRANRAAMLALVNELNERMATAREGGGERAIQKMRARG